MKLETFVYTAQLAFPKFIPRMLKKISSAESKLLGTFLKVWMPTCTAYACFGNFIYVAILYCGKKPQLNIDLILANTTQN